MSLKKNKDIKLSSLLKEKFINLDLKETDKKEIIAELVGLIAKSKKLTNKKAFLKASGIELDEFDFVFDEQKKSGKQLDELLGNPYFQAELKGKREAKANLEATPTGTGRTASSPKDSVDYWRDKEGLPDDPKLQRDVVNARMERDRNKGMFTDTPVIK